MYEPIRSLFDAAAGDRCGSPVGHIAVIGNALPRRCGLATFTSHVVDALRDRYPDLTVDHYAMNDGSGVVYPDGIRTITADDPAAYRLAAGLIEASGAQAIWVQHEFGIFGGEAGSHILRLVERSTLPIIATLHTVLEHPSPVERHVLDALLGRASHVIVMAERGRRILREVYGVDDARITVIPHGVPDRPHVDPSIAKAHLDLGGGPIIMTFGLLAPDKGIEVMIEAMPAIVAAHPDCRYILIGATHPNLVREQGEAYRDGLAEMAVGLGIAANIQFIDAFLEQEELLDWLEACDVYVTPYLNMAQITSGTLSYAIGLGKPVVSTPYLHAAEILADDHGILVPPRDAVSLAIAVNGLLADDLARDALAGRAYALGRCLLWPKAVERALDLIGRARGARPGQLPAAVSPLILPPQLDAVMRMTDATGILQHGIHSIADRNHGYCIDDNARALILMCRLAAEENDAVIAARLGSTYAAFVHHAWNAELGRFRNFMGYDRRWCEDVGSEDSNGRALWALGCAAAGGIDPGMRDWGRMLFDQAAPLATNLGSPRAMAFAALGAVEMLVADPGHGVARRMLTEAADMLKMLLAAARRPDWAWFETVLAYDNARLPEALLRTGMALADPAAIDVGLETLDWIVAAQTNARGDFRPVGTDSFHRPYGNPLPFDQQPLEAQATIDACLAALAATGDARWADAARHAYGWFLGENDLGLPLVHSGDGGCHDGLMPHGVNRNQGAESILALQLSNVAMARLATMANDERSRNAA